MYTLQWLVKYTERYKTPRGFLLHRRGSAPVRSGPLRPHLHHNIINYKLPTISSFCDFDLSSLVSASVLWKHTNPEVSRFLVFIASSAPPPPCTPLWARLRPLTGSSGRWCERRSWVLDPVWCSCWSSGDPRSAAAEPGRRSPAAWRPRPRRRSLTEQHTPWAQSKYTRLFTSNLMQTAENVCGKLTSSWFG